KEKIDKKLEEFGKLDDEMLINNIGDRDMEKYIDTRTKCTKIERKMMFDGLGIISFYFWLQKTYENLCSILEITKSDVNITDDIKLIETLVDIIVEHRHSFYDGIDTEEVFSVLLYVMFHLKQKNFKTFESLMRKFCEGWCSVNMNLEESINAENNVASFSRINLKNKLTRIKVLKMLYGLLEFSEFGYYLLINMIQFAMKHNVYNYLRFTCNDLETWVACTVISDEEKRNLINIVYPELLKLNDVNMAIKIFNLLFSTYPKNSNRELITRDVVKHFLTKHKDVVSKNEIHQRNAYNEMSEKFNNVIKETQRDKIAMTLANH
ncbi:hypothetical protein A3Q56_07168, partial [Intoshia linei]